MTSFLMTSSVMEFTFSSKAFVGHVLLWSCGGGLGLNNKGQSANLVSVHIHFNNFLFRLSNQSVNPSPFCVTPQMARRSTGSKWLLQLRAFADSPDEKLSPKQPFLAMQLMVSGGFSHSSWVSNRQSSQKSSTSNFPIQQL